jgi:hypothetical protein
MPEIELDLNGNARFICYASVTALDLDLKHSSAKDESCEQYIQRQFVSGR